MVNTPVMNALEKIYDTLQEANMSTDITIQLSEHDLSQFKHEVRELNFVSRYADGSNRFMSMTIS